MKILRSFLIVPLLLICSCSYLKYTSIQSEYARIQEARPGQVNVKHMIDRENYFIIGKTIDDADKYAGVNLAVAAYSNKFKNNERVDTMYFAGTDTHFGLTLPEGVFTLVVFADTDTNNIFDQSEIVGQRILVLNDKNVPEKVYGHVEISLAEPITIDWVESIPLPETEEPLKSLFFPTGTIRSLDDPIFDDNIATLGMYDPASFSEKVHTMFFALEEDLAYKIPVIFVHGIGGSSRAFSPIVERLDAKRYKPWFFYYPSGGDLEQLSELFYKVFMSGKIANLDKMPIIIVAHSMGGLVVREALNRYGRTPKENRVKMFISIATPFGGHPTAASGEKHGMIVLPAWRDLNPQNPFINELYRKPIPDTIEHHLLYAFQNPEVLKMSENSDGVVPLSSQLFPAAQKQSHDQFGFNSSHTGILENEDMITHVLEKIDTVKSFFPDEHLDYFYEGGYDVELGDDYSPMAQYYIRTYGNYVMAITKGTLPPFYPEQEEFLRIINGEKPPSNDVEKSWLKFLREFPEISQQQRQ